MIFLHSVVITATLGLSLDDAFALQSAVQFGVGDAFFASRAYAQSTGFVPAIVGGVCLLGGCEGLFSGLVLAGILTTTVAITAEDQHELLFGDTSSTVSEIQDIRGPGAVFNESDQEVIDDLIGGTADDGSRKTKRRRATGGEEQANKDFENAAGDLPIKDHGGGIRSVELPGGTSISVRPDSTVGVPTIQITPPKGKQTKIRYDN